MFSCFVDLFGWINWKSSNQMPLFSSVEETKTTTTFVWHLFAVSLSGMFRGCYAVKLNLKRTTN